MTTKRSQAPRSRQGEHHQAMIAVLMQFRVVVRSIKQHYGSVQRQCGVSGAQLWALAQVDASPGLRVGDLANQLAVHQSTASNIVDRLEEARLVARRRVGDDRRVVRVFLTARGATVLRRAPRPLRGVLQQALLDLPTPSLRALRRDLASLLRHLARHGAAATSAPLSDVMLDGDARAAGRRRGSTPGAARAAPRRTAR